MGSRGNAGGMPGGVVLGMQERLPYEMVSRSIELTEHSVYLCDEIDEPLAYVELLSALRMATENDHFIFYLNTPGGRLDTGLQLMHAIQDTDALVTMVLDPQAYSMGALLFLSGDELRVPPHSTLMFHNYSSGLIGKGNEQLAEVQAASRSYRKVLERVCRPFLTADEVSGVLNGQDLWLDSDEILRRLTRMQRAHDAEAERQGKPKRKGKSRQETHAD